MMKSPALRFPHFLESWESHKLGDLASITMGQSPNSDSYNDVGQGLPLIQGNADLKNGWTQPSRFTTEAPKTCEAKDIILSVRAPVGELARAPEPCCIGRGVCAIRPHASLPTNSDFIYYLLTAKKKEWAKLEQGSTFTAVSGNDISTLQLHAPSIQEQELIAFFFSLLDKKISLTERKVNSLKSLLKGVQQKAFIERKQETKSTSNPYSCILYTLGEISESFYSGQTPKSAINDFYCGNIPWATSLDLNRSTVLSTIKTISKEGLDSCNLKILPKGSFVISTCGVEAENVAGNCGLLGIDSAISQSLMCIKPKPELVSTEFLFYWYRHFGKSICKRYAHGTKQLHLNFDLMSNLEIVLPSLEEQSKIVDILSKLDEKISLAEQRVLAYKKIKQALLQQMFV